MPTYKKLGITPPPGQRPDAVVPGSYDGRGVKRKDLPLKTLQRAETQSPVRQPRTRRRPLPR
jgi:hypothetical protein